MPIFRLDFCAIGSTTDGVVTETRLLAPPRLSSGALRGASAGDRAVEYVGLGVGPEDFYVSDPNGGLFAQGEYAIVYTTLASAQELIDRPGQVNDLVLTLAEGGEQYVFRRLHPLHPEAGTPSRRSCRTVGMRWRPDAGELPRSL